MTLERRILETLRGQPGLDVERVKLAVSDTGRVTLDGIVPTYADKCAVEEAVARIPDVAGVRNHLEVRLTIGDYRPDDTLERVLREMVDCLARMPADRPRVSVLNGWVTLEGMVQYPFQKQLVENAVREVAGVLGITNRIAIEKRRTKRPPLSVITS